LRWLFPQSADIERNVDENYSGRIQIRAIGGYVVKSMDASYQEIRGIPDKTTLESMTWRFQSREPDATYRGAELRVAVNGDVDSTLSTQVASPQSTQTYTFWDMARYRRRQRSSYALPVKTISPVSHRTDVAAERYSEVVFKRQTESLLELIRLFDPGVVGMQILGGDVSDLYLEHRKSGLTPLNAFGDGVRRAVIIALTLPSIENGVLLIDEIETAIHITVLNEVYRWLLTACQRLNVQLFATTHSLEAVDALLKAHTEPYDDLALYQLGHLGAPAKRFSGELLNRLLVERGLDVR
jgi:hypothetical protein